MHRQRTIRAFVLAGLGIVTLVIVMAGYAIEMYVEEMAKIEQAKVREMFGPTPPSPEEAARLRRQQVYRAIQIDGMDAAMSRYGVSRQDVERILEEGRREQWR